MKRMHEEFLEYYQRELGELRSLGLEFARRYPKIAARLELGAEQSADPFTERLVESFAFLSARIRRNISAERGYLAASLLGTLYPNFVSPVPSMGIAQMQPDPKGGGDLRSGIELPRGTELFCDAVRGDVTLRWRSVYPVKLWPLAVSEAAFEPADKYEFLDRRREVASVLRLRITGEGAELSECGVDSLRFFLHGDRSVTYFLHELIFASGLGAALLAPGGRPVFLGADSLRPVGFENGEGALPDKHFAHSGYRLLQEYFAFPEKFLFFEVAGLEQRQASPVLDILVLLDRQPERRLKVSPGNFRLGATPVVNLFNRITDPIRLDHTKTEYMLVADARRNFFTEVHSVDSVSGMDPGKQESTQYEPYFSLTHHRQEGGQRAFWLGRREAARAGLPGTELYLSFVDLDFRPSLPPARTVFARVACTNRHMAEEAQAGTLLQLGQDAPLSHVRLLMKPSRQLDPVMEGGSLWRLVSQLSLNHLSLESGEAGLNALREILRLYCPSSDPYALQQIRGVRKMSCRRCVTRTGCDDWRGFVRGLRVELEFDESDYAGGSAFLLASVLNRFFGMYAAINSFTRLVATRDGHKGAWKQWPPMAGSRKLL